MFLKVEGVTGESGDADHKGEIDVVSWSWGLQAPSDVATGLASGRRRLSELQITKKVDRATPVLMQYLSRNTKAKTAVLTVRKAGKTPLTYFKISMKEVRVASVKTESVDAELMDRVNFTFAEVTITYTPQDASGAKGGGDVEFSDTWALET